MREKQTIARRMAPKKDQQLFRKLTERNSQVDTEYHIRRGIKEDKKSMTTLAV